MKPNEKYFYCYSNRLFKFLEICGLRYAFYGINQNNNKEYHAYEKTDTLEVLLKEWENLKQKLDLEKVKTKSL